MYVSLSGFGQVGPYRDRGAYDVIIQAMGGLMGITGPAGGGPTRVGASVGDIVPALYATVAALAALQRRERTGRGLPRRPGDDGRGGGRGRERHGALLGQR